MSEPIEQKTQSLSVDYVLDALEGMANQYLSFEDEKGRTRYDHAFMGAGEECLEVLISAGRLPDWADYRTGGLHPDDQPK